MGLKMENRDVVDMKKCKSLDEIIRSPPRKHETSKKHETAKTRE